MELRYLLKPCTFFSSGTCFLSILKQLLGFKINPAFISFQHLADRNVLSNEELWVYQKMIKIALAPAI